VLCYDYLVLVLFLGESKDLLGHHSKGRKCLAREQDGRPGQKITAQVLLELILV
jgi:hypothetical protein